MAGNFKLILMITLASVCFLPKDGVDAQDESRLTCYACDAVVLGIAECEPGNSKRIYQCPSKTCSLLVYEYDEPDSRSGQRRTRMKMDCGEVGRKIGCYAVTVAHGGKGTSCTCNTTYWNSDLNAAGFKENDLGGPSGPDGSSGKEGSSGEDGTSGSGSSHLIGWFSLVSISVFVTVIDVSFFGRP